MTRIGMFYTDKWNAANIIADSKITPYSFDYYGYSVNGGIEGVNATFATLEAYGGKPDAHYEPLRQKFEDGLRSLGVSYFMLPNFLAMVQSDVAKSVAILRMLLVDAKQQDTDTLDNVIHRMIINEYTSLEGHAGLWQLFGYVHTRLNVIVSQRTIEELGYDDEIPFDSKPLVRRDLGAVYPVVGNAPTGDAWWSEVFDNLPEENRR